MSDYYCADLIKLAHKMEYLKHHCPERYKLCSDLAVVSVHSFDYWWQQSDEYLQKAKADYLGPEPPESA